MGAVFGSLLQIVQASPPPAPPSGSWLTTLVALNDGDPAPTAAAGEQYDLKTTYPGSGNPWTYVKTTGPAGSFPGAPVLPTSTVAFVISGVTWTATMPTTLGSDLWLNGTLVKEGRRRVVPLNGATPHPNLAVLFDIRAFWNGDCRVDICVENCLDNATGAPINYTAVFKVGGVTKYDTTTDPNFTSSSRSGPGGGVLTHYYLCRWRYKAWGAGADASYSQDLTKFYTSKLLHRWVPDGVHNTIDALGSGKRFGPMQWGDSRTYQSDHGGRTELAPIPGQYARMCVFGNLGQVPYVLAMADSSASWPIHAQNADGSRVDLTVRTDFWMDPRAKTGPIHDCPAGAPLPAQEYGSDPFSNAGLISAGYSPLLPDRAHMISFTYFPYLMTGDRFYSDEAAWQADYAMTRTVPSDRAKVVFGEDRAMAWTTRNIVDALVICPDGHPGKAYWESVINARLSFMSAYQANHPTVSGGVSWGKYETPTNQPSTNSREWISESQQSYFSWAIYHCNRVGYSGGENWTAALDQFWIGYYAVCVSSGKPLNIGAYRIAVGGFKPTYNGGVGTAGDLAFVRWGDQSIDAKINYYASSPAGFADVYNNTWIELTDFAPNSGWQAYAMRMSLIRAVELGTAGALDLYNYIITKLTDGTTISGIQKLWVIPGWAYDVDP